MAAFHICGRPGATPLYGALLSPETTAANAFADFLIFDALIGNTDRHSKNWAVETSLTGRDRLAPTFDHATSMGITTRGPARDLLLAEPGRIPDFATKATAHRFADGRGESLVDFAIRFARSYASDSLLAWHGRLDQLSSDVIAARVGAAKMTGDGARLATALLAINRERIMKCLI